MKSKKGQISIEFMLIILICLGYLQLLTVNVLEPAIDAAQDTTRLGQAKLSAEKLATTINEMGSSLGEGKRTLHLFVPKNSEIICNDTTKEIYFSMRLCGLEATECGTVSPYTNPDGDADSTLCTNKISVNSPPLSCNGLGSKMQNLYGDKGKFETIVIEKDISGIDVS